MIEKIKKVSNPLTVIGIFAGLAEVMGTVALPLISNDIQPLFICFLIGFPIYLVTVFFLTLNFNPRVLYSPSDFTNEDNFLKVMSLTKSVSENYEVLEERLRDFRDNIQNDIFENYGNAAIRTEELTKGLTPKIEELINAIDTANNSNRAIIDTVDTANIDHSGSKEEQVLSIIRKSKNGVWISEISRELKISHNTTKHILNILQIKGSVERIDEGRGRWSRYIAKGQQSNIPLSPDGDYAGAQ